jgi:hypothetical protein
LLCAETPGKVNAENVNAYGPSPIQDLEQHAAWSEARRDAGYPD